MPCHSPLLAVRREGGVKIIRKDPKHNTNDSLLLPCGKCIGCRLEYSKQWAVRCMHEAQMWKENSFVTLTYNEENLPYGSTLVPEHFTRFIRALRKTTADPIRYFMCGEYGENFSRPHYHAILFNYWPEDAEEIGQWYHSEKLQSVWRKGFVTIGHVTFDSAAYTARYVLKKMTGRVAELHYQKVVEETGEIIQLQPEYSRMSNRPGIGNAWIKKYVSDVYPDDFVVHDGRKMKAPRYYDKFLQDTNPELFEKLSAIRKREAQKDPANCQYHRHAREEIQKSKAKIRLRSYESDNFHSERQ